jgi:hypothetical protein
MVAVAKCPNPNSCRAETDYGTGVTECECGMIGWLSKDGELYNDPSAANRPLKRKAK